MLRRGRGNQYVSHRSPVLPAPSQFTLQVDSCCQIADLDSREASQRMD